MFTRRNLLRSALLPSLAGLGLTRAAGPSARSVRRDVRLMSRLETTINRLNGLNDWSPAGWDRMDRAVAGWHGAKDRIIGAIGSAVGSDLPAAIAVDDNLLIATHDEPMGAAIGDTECAEVILIRLPVARVVRL
jgi:hypothetical protein